MRLLTGQLSANVTQRSIFTIMSYRLDNIRRSLVQDTPTRLQEVRERAKMDTADIRAVIFGRGEYEKYLLPLNQHFNNNRHIYSQHNIEGKDLKQMRKDAATMMFDMNKFMKIDIEKDPMHLMFALYGCYDCGLTTKGNLQNMLYTKSIQLYGHLPEHKEFLEKGKTYEHIGCFGLTEFHHGSYSKAIGTLAHYRPETKDFLLTTQGTKGMKHWIGAASEVANMAVIWAQLIVDGVSHGPHPFLLQMRCFKTHKALPGVRLGDCGPKNGLNGIDNGYIILENVVVPKHSLLGKLGNVNEEGKYESIIQSKSQRFGLHMSALSGGRALVSFTINNISVNALTIALRYACSRKQFDNPKKTDEIILMDYPLTKIRLLPFFATTIMQHISGRHICYLYLKDTKWMTDMNYVMELHSISVSVKARHTWSVVKGLPECRAMMGGHGYSYLSRQASLFNDADVNNTWEGDNHMLLQQTSKYLMRAVPNPDHKTSIIDLSFARKKRQVDFDKIIENPRDLSNIKAMVEDLFRVKFNNAQLKMKELKERYQDKEEVWYHFHPEAGNSLSLTYADIFILKKALNTISQAQTQAVKDMTTRCIQLWALQLLEQERYGPIQLRQALQKEVLALCEQLSDSAVVVTDAIAAPAYVIGSPFANFEGDGLKEYMHLLYTNKDTFRRVDYYAELLEAKKAMV